MTDTDWTRHLPPEARTEMDAELAGLDGEQRDVAEAAWKSTGEVYGDPELLAALSSDSADDDEPMLPETAAGLADLRDRPDPFTAWTGQPLLISRAVQASLVLRRNRPHPRPLPMCGTGDELLANWAPQTDTTPRPEYRYESMLDEPADPDRAHRLAAGFALARHLGTPEGREQVAAAGHRDGQEIVVVLDGDSDEYVAGRVSGHDGDVIVVRYEPGSKTLSIRQDDRP